MSLDPEAAITAKDAVDPVDDEHPDEFAPGCPAFMQLGSNICERRTAIGASVDALAAALGADGAAGRSWVRNLEKGATQTGVLKALRLAGALDITLDQLVEGIFWNPGEIAKKPRERKSQADRLRGYLSIVPAGLPAFEEPGEVVFVSGRHAVARVIARNVKEARARRHLLQRDLGLADTAGAGLIESGQRVPEVLGVLTIARSLELPPEQLLAGMRWEPSQGPTSAPKKQARRQDFHAHDDAVARLWREDLTASQIAVELGITQPAVEGIVRRMRARGVYLPSRARGRRTTEEISVGEPAPAPIEAPADEVLLARVAGNLKRSRGLTGLSMEQLAEAAETNVSAIWQAETTGRGLKLFTVVRLAGALRIPLSRVTEGVSWNRDARVLQLASEVPPPIDPGRVLGTNVRRHRRGLRLSQEDLAARTGIQRRHLSAIESGRSIPQPVTVLALASGLEVDLRQLFAGTYDWYVRPLPPPEFADGQGPPSKAERQEILLRLWGEGAGTRMIAEALDTTPSNVGGTINELRAIGVDIPYRHPPTSADQLGRRLRRRRKGRGLN